LRKKLEHAFEQKPQSFTKKVCFLLQVKKTERMLRQ
jgi:hypothetical protein